MYAIQQYNKYDMYSTRYYSNTVTVTFDYAYLVDATHQLKLNFNPQVAVFQNDLLEAKVDTLGHQYPYIFRNGVVKYKEFSIGGLLSKRSDDDNLFTSTQFFDNNTLRTATPHSYNNLINTDEFAVEQKYKMEVLEWLNNGKPKLFKSPTEGNFIVRLLNVSLAPEEALGRMLHNFISTAYEIAAYTDTNLLKYNIILDKRELQLNNYTVQNIYSGQLADLQENPLIINGQDIGLQIYVANPFIATNKVNVELQYSDNTSASLTVGASGSLIIEPNLYDIVKATIAVSGETIAGSYSAIAQNLMPIAFSRYQSAQLDPVITINEYEHDTEGQIDIIPLLHQTNVDYIRDLHSIAFLQLIRRYPINTHPEKQYVVQIKFANTLEYETIDLTSLYQYQASNLQKITSLLIPNGVKAILGYKMVTISIAEE